jgi:hypothetical protein
MICMSTAATFVTEADILQAVVAPQEPGLEPPLARSLLGLNFTHAQVTRMHELADKNNEGNITPDERAEMENYARVGNFLSLIQSKARLSLKALGETR